MTPKKLLEELEERERQFYAATEVVKKHREQTDCKMVWITRSVDSLQEDMEDARKLPGIKDQLEQLDNNPSKSQQAGINTLFNATEGVSRAKALAYFEEIKSLKEQLKEMAKKDEQTGETTFIRCAGQNLVWQDSVAFDTAVGHVEDLVAQAECETDPDKTAALLAEAKAKADTLEKQSAKGAEGAKTSPQPSAVAPEEELD